jgi:hypothetical protein
MNDKDREDAVRKLLKGLDVSDLDELKRKLVTFVPKLPCEDENCPSKLHRFLLHVDTVSGMPVGVSICIEDRDTSEVEEILIVLPDVIEMLEIVSNMITLQTMRTILGNADLTDDAPDDLSLH